MKNNSLLFQSIKLVKMNNSFIPICFNKLILSTIIFLIISFFISCESDINSAKNPEERFDVIFESKYYIGPNWSESSDLTKVSSGGYIVAGRANMNGAVLLRISEEGNIIWYKNFNAQNLHSVIETNDNGFAATGGYTDGVYILKTDLNGNTLWQRNISFPYAEDARKIIQTANGDFFILANSYETHGNARLILLGNDGTTKWIKIIEGTSGTDIYGVSEDLGGNIKVIGSDKNDPQTSGWIINIDQNGNQINKKIINGDISFIGSTWHELSTIRISQSEFVGVGIEQFLTIDTSGIIKNQQTIPIPDGSSDIRLYSIAKSSNNNFIAGGFQSYTKINDSTQVYESIIQGGLFLLNQDGTLIENILIGYKASFCSISSVIYNEDNSIIVAGYSSPIDSANGSIWVKKIKLK